MADSKISKISDPKNEFNLDEFPAARKVAGSKQSISGRVGTPVKLKSNERHRATGMGYQSIAPPSSTSEHPNGLKRRGSRVSADRHRSRSEKCDFKFQITQALCKFQWRKCRKNPGPDPGRERNGRLV